MENLIEMKRKIKKNEKESNERKRRVVNIENLRGVKKSERCPCVLRLWTVRRNHLRNQIPI